MGLEEEKAMAVEEKAMAVEVKAMAVEVKAMAKAMAGKSSPVLLLMGLARQLCLGSRLYNLSSKRPRERFRSHNCCRDSKMHMFHRCVVSSGDSQRMRQPPEEKKRKSGREDHVSTYTGSHMQNSWLIPMTKPASHWPWHDGGGATKSPKARAPPSMAHTRSA